MNKHPFRGAPAIPHAAFYINEGIKAAVNYAEGRKTKHYVEQVQMELEVLRMYLKEMTAEEDIRRCRMTIAHWNNELIRIVG
ncbi:hypothetical protein [Endozoicomonas ascidiicola]|uniref:hypothetical protein n=1 Tax=Endozoicomonas ascidiicola TaxID=1698521 RepID=UPI0008334803|nr:hypothetical protein [Endozoicomonas ascidiicola]